MKTNGAPTSPPNPEPACTSSDPDGTPAVRRLECARYDDCLDVAIACGWRGFTCHACHAFEPLSPDEKRRDFRGLLRMAAELLAEGEHMNDDAQPGEAEEDAA